MSQCASPKRSGIITEIKSKKVPYAIMLIVVLCCLEHIKIKEQTENVGKLEMAKNSINSFLVNIRVLEILVENQS